MAETLQVPARRWLQFRLRTLLLAPVFILLLQVFSDQLFDHLIWLWCAYGALFGAAWAVGRMRIVGLRRTGLARIWPVAKAAIDGGMIGGALLGAPVLWTALWRSGAWRYFNTRGIASDAWEIFTSGVAGYWCGGFVGGLAGGAAGTVAAYLVWLTVRAFGAAAWLQAPALAETDTIVAAGRTGGWRPRRRMALAILLACGPPIWAGICLWGDWTERATIDRLRAQGFVSHHRIAYGPQWFEHTIAPGYELSWFRRGGQVTYRGPVDTQAVRDLLSLREVQAIYLEVDTESDLILAAELLGRRPEISASIASHGALNLTWDRSTGVFQFSGLISVQTLDEFMQLTGLQGIQFNFETDADLRRAAAFLRRRPAMRASIALYGPQVTDDGLASLEGLTNLEQLYFNRNAITDRSIEFVKSLPNLTSLTALCNLQLSKAGETRLYLAAPSSYISRTTSYSWGKWNIQRLNQLASSP